MRGVGGSGCHGQAGALVRTGALLCCAALLAGCASMPDSGEVRKVGDEQHADADSQVRVFGVKPQEGESALEIVRGFLEATTSDDPTYGTAREYLMPELAESWDPFEKVTVLLGGPSPYREPLGTDSKENDREAVVGLSGDKIATVDREHAYTAAEGPFRTSFHLAKDSKGEWRIDEVAPGLVLNESDFQRIYGSYNMYYYAGLGPEAGSTASREDVLVADPVYLPKRIDPMKAVVGALLDGPTQWLKPVADSVFPAGTRLKDVSVGDEQELTVRLSKAADQAGTEACERMAAQLLYTVQGQAATKLDRVEVLHEDDSSGCTLTSGRAEAYAPDKLTGAAAQQFFIDTDQRLVGLAGEEDTQAHPVEGPFGDQQVQLRSVAVKRDEEVAAGVRTGGRELCVAGLTEGAEAAKLWTSKAQKASDGLTAPSWDGYGDLWVADRDPDDPQLLMWRNGEGDPVDVSVPNLGDGRIESLRVAADGVRIAMRVHQGGRTILQVGRIERHGTQLAPEVSVTELRTVTPRLADVETVSWAGSSRLVVVGREADGVQQIQYVNTDGSAPDTASLPSIGGVVSVAASENQSKPLLAGLESGIYRLPADGNWKAVTPKGTEPVYPG